MTELKPLFEAQREFRWEVKAWDLHHRKNLLRLLKDAIHAHEEDIYKALTDDFQKPRFETLMSEIGPVLAEINYTLKHLKCWSSPKRVSSGRMLMGTSCEIHREARGTVLILSPWNYPFQLAMIPVISALAAGNTVILKPSEVTPATSQIIQKILSEIFEPRLVSVVQGGADVAEKLLALPFDHIFFTGSTKVGKIVMKAAAEHLASVTLELGGKSPTIVDSTCDLELTAKKIVWGKFLNSGQTCIAPDYLFVDQKIEKPFTAALAKEIELQLKGEINAQIITERHCQRLKKLVESCEGQILTPWTVGESRRLPPTLVLRPKLSSALMQEEIFGPVLPILTYSDLQDVIRHIQKEPKPLSMYIFSKDKDFVAKVLAETSAGGVCVNDTLIHFASHHLPFGGVGESGMGRYHGEYGHQTFSHEKAVLTQGLFEKAVTLFYPPYTEKMSKLYRMIAGL